MSNALSPPTLPALLARQATERPHAIALRHKRLGIWVQWQWRQLADEALRVAESLRVRGFSRGTQLVLLTRPRTEALVLSLAAQALGGVVVPLDPEDTTAAIPSLLLHLQPAFLFAEGQLEVDQVLRACAPGHLIYADTRGLRSHPSPALQTYSSLLASPPAPLAALCCEGSLPAFHFYRLTAAGEIESHALTHRELLAEAVTLLHRENIGAQDDALATRAFAAPGQARYLIAPWLQSGFTLNFPETPETRDRDRRDLEPTVVAGTGDTYDRITAMVMARLPAEGSRLRHLVDWSLSPSHKGLGRWMAHWLVRRPLRQVLGYARTRVLLLIGAQPSPATLDLLEALQLTLRHWPDAAEWRSVPEPAAKRQPVDWTPGALTGLDAVAATLTA